MISYEVLRLYPIVVEPVGFNPKELKLEKVLLLARIEVSVLMFLDLLLARSTCGFLGDRVEGRSKVVLVNSENRFHLSNTIELDEGGVVSLSNTKPVEEQKRRRKKQRATAQVSHFNARFKEQEEESSGKRKQHAKALGDGGRLVILGFDRKRLWTT
ncbi:hypothetical protein V6N13_085380 [Hibiscus sabdariffa]